MQKRRSLGSFRFGREEDEFAALQPAATLKNERRSSLRSFGGSVRSLFGREEDDAEDNPLSDFQQQSLSVFESEHMWAHFKAHLADNKIQTAAGVRAMLPEFVNDRVLDGSVRSDRPVYPACTKPAFVGSPTHSMDVSERCNSIDYSQTLRGDAGHVLSLHETVNTEAQKSSDAKGLGKVIPACLTIDNSKRSVLSSLGWSGDEHSIDVSDNRKSSDHTASLSLDLSSRLSLDLSSRRSLDLSSQRRALDLSSRRANFLSTLGMTKEAPLEVNKKSGSGSGPRRHLFKSSSCRPKFVRPVESNDRNITGIKERNSGQDFNETVDEGDKDTFDSRPFSYRPSRSLSAPPDFRKVRRASISSRVSSDTSTLLVEWGENDELSSDEDDEEDENSSGKLDDSERALMMSMNGSLVVDWNNEDDDGDSVDSCVLDRGIFADNSR